MIGLFEWIALKFPGVARVVDNIVFTMGRSTAADLPDVAEWNRGGLLRREGDTGVADAFYLNRKDASDTQNWEELLTVEVADTLYSDVAHDHDADYQPLDADLTAIAALADPNADRGLFWDDSAGTWKHLAFGTGLAVSDVTLNLDQILAVQSADYTGANVNTEQKFFNVSANGAATVAGSTTYLMDATIGLYTTGTTSHALELRWGGTATITSMGYLGQVLFTATDVVASAINMFWASSDGDLQIVGALATATYYTIHLKGMVRINGGGTFIPQYRFSAAPGVAPVTRQNSWFRLIPVGNNTVQTVGTWS